MAPPKKSRSLKKRFSHLNEVSPDQDVGNPNRSSKRKRKLSNKLGSQWSNEELEHFYEAYRKHGQDWRKVAAAVRNRSVEMVEALYIMNRAYLSLPEGTASVAGLKAMMTDHYSVLEGSDSEPDSNYASGISSKLQKPKRAKVQYSVVKEDLSHSRSIAPTVGCLSLLKKRPSDGIQARAVGKRTPRFPVSYTYKKDDIEDHFSPNKRGWRSEAHANDDEGVHVAALALTEASQRGGSPQVSQTPHRTMEHTILSPVQSCERMHPKTGRAHARLHDASIDEDWPQGSTVNCGVENGENATRFMVDMEGVGTVEIHRKRKSLYGKKHKVEDVGNDQFDDGTEACSGTEEHNVTALKVDIKVSDANTERSPQGQRKRRKKLYGDGSSALDHLADLSLMLPASIVESESSVQSKEERTKHDMDDKLAVPEATSTSGHRDKIRIPRMKEKVVPAISGVQSTTSRKSKLGKDLAVNVNVFSEAKRQIQSGNKTSKGKRKSLVSEIYDNMAPHLSEFPEAEAFCEEEDNNVPKAKYTFSGISKQRKSLRMLEGSSGRELKRTWSNVATPTKYVTAASQVSLPTRQNKRKVDLKRRLIRKEIKSSENFPKNQPKKYSTSPRDGAPHLKERISSCLSSYMVRRWCIFEWFYSAIEYPWFAKREFVEYLNHVGLGHIPRLTRVEWGVIRSSLGKPRRFSEHFLREEREKLKQYRESVRKHYNELRNGIKEGLPTDLARPLSVGQRVIALHPKTREVHDGSVLTVDHEKCRVQFDRPEIGVEFVMDVDCMPLNPLENMPEALRRRSTAVDKFPVMSKELLANGHPNFGGPMVYTSSGHMEHALSPRSTLMKQSKEDTKRSIANTAVVDIVGAQQAAYTQPSMEHIQARAADICALSELTRALDKKDALVMELKNANNDILESQNGDNSIKDTELFKKQYATVLVQLKEASGQVSSALVQLRQRNTHPGNSLPPWMKHPLLLNIPSGLSSSLDNSSFTYQEAGSNVVEIVKGSRIKAHAMVDAAIQAMSSVKEEEDAFTKIGEALDSFDSRQVTSDLRVSVIRPPDQVNGTLGYNSQLNSLTSEPVLGGHVPDPVLCNGSLKDEAQIPSELITSCVANLLMIQTCTQRQYPPADVAQILDFAVKSLHPCCPRNLPIYREIQMSMGRLKTQILALVPTSI